MDKIKIVIRNVHFAVTVTKSLEHQRLMAGFNDNLVTYKVIYIPHLKKMVRQEDRRFYYQVGKYTFHYSIHLLNTFVKRLLKQGCQEKDIIVTKDTIYKPGVLKATMRDKFSDRDHQPLYIDKALTTNPMVLVDLKTGKGKTYISMRVSTQLKQPTGIVVLSRYIEKWINDVKELTTVTDDDIYVVKGKDSLVKLLKSDKVYDFIIFSLSTLRNYIKQYDEDPSNHLAAPESLFKYLGLGILLTDEVHQSFHAGYMTITRLNPLKVVALSATLDNLDRGIKFMYATLYPNTARCGQLVKFRAHPIVIAVNYYIDNPERMRYLGPRGYSHTLFEQNILRNSVFRKMYLEMILHYVNKGYIAKRREGDKVLILVQTVLMATIVTNYLKSRLRGLVINRYVEEDPYENIIESDISVSTNLSSGTALDIPNLIMVLQTVSIGSLQANVQALGRLREIKGIDVKYYYLYSSNLPSQYKLHETRRSVIKHLAKEYKYEEYSKRFKTR